MHGLLSRFGLSSAAAGWSAATAARGFRSTAFAAGKGPKTHSGAKKRFRVGGNSKKVNVKMSQAGRRHLAQPTNRKKRRDQGQTVYVEGSHRKRVLRMLRMR